MPNDPGVNILKGLALYGLERYGDVLISCEETMRLVIEVSKKRLAEVESFGRIGRHDELNAAMREVERVEAVFSKARCIKAKALFMSGKYREATREINAEVGADMKDSKGAALLCMVINELCMKDDPGQAERMRLSKPDEPALYAYKEIMIHLVKTHEEELKHANQGVHVHPDDAAAHAACSDALRGMDSAWKALDAIREAVRLDPRNVRHLCAKAVILRELGLMKDFGAAAREAQNADPDDPEARAHVGFGTYMEGSKEDGMEIVQEAREADEHDPVILLYLATMLALEGEVDAAMSLCKPAVLADPYNGRMRSLLVWLLEVPGVP